MNILVQKQKYGHQPPEIIGDCYRTCVAMLLGEMRDEVPHFLDMAWKEDVDNVGAVAERLLLDWLKPRGLYRIALGSRMGSVKDALEFGGAVFGELPYMFCGTSSMGTGHCVIACGSEIVADPSLVNSGIVGPSENGDGSTSYQYEVYMRLPRVRWTNVGDASIRRDWINGD